MSKLSTPKVAAKKARGARGKIAAKVAVVKARTSRATHRRTNSKVVAEKARGARGKIAAKVAVAKARTSRATHRRTNSKAVAEKAHVQRKTAPQVAAGELLDTRRIAAQFEKFRETQVPDTMRALAQKNMAQTRELYERSRGTLRSVLESWEKSFGAAAQGAVALNRKVLDIAEGNIDTNFALATGLAGAKNFADVMALHAAYWRKRFGNLSAQAEEVRALSTKLTANVAEPIKETGWMEEARRPKPTKR
jgi:hypothetical protein